MLSAVSGIAITLFTMLAVSIGGPISVNISGTLKDVVLTYVGFLLFDDIQPTMQVQVGLVLSFFGALYYIYDNFYGVKVSVKKVK